MKDGSLGWARSQTAALSAVTGPSARHEGAATSARGLLTGTAAPHPLMALPPRRPKIFSSMRSVTSGHSTQRCSTRCLFLSCGAQRKKARVGRER